MPGYEVYPLGQLMDATKPELLAQRLREFRCVRDTQLEQFIHEYATVYEKKGFGRTYLVFDASAGSEATGEQIAAFFTLGITATDYSGINRSRREKVLGSKPGRDTFNSFGGILIGQLARDDRYSPDFIDGEALLKECEAYIEMGRRYIGGRIVYLDCREALVQTYRKSGYRPLADSPSEEGYYKMYKVLPDKAIA